MVIVSCREQGAGCRAKGARGCAAGAAMGLNHWKMGDKDAVKVHISRDEGVANDYYSNIQDLVNGVVLFSFDTENLLADVLVAIGGHGVLI